MKYLALGATFIATMFTITCLADCPVARYAVKGRVLECGSKEGLRGAKVAVYLNQSRENPKSLAWLDVPEDGRFETIVLFHTFWSYSRLRGHDCGKVPTLVGVFIWRPGEAIKRKEVTNFKMRGYTGNPGSIDVPDICVEPNSTDPHPE